MKRLLLPFVLIIGFMSYGQVPATSYQHLFTGGSLAGFSHTGSALALETDRLGAPTNAVSLNGDHLGRTGFTSDHVTASMWIKTSTDDATVRTIIDHTDRSSPANTTGERGWYVYLENGTVNMAGNYFYAYYYGVPPNGEYRTFHTGYRFANGTTNVADGEWHHVMASGQALYTGGSSLKYIYKIYVDGVLEDTEIVEVIVSQLNTNWELLPTGSIVVANNASATLVDKYEDAIDDIRLYGSILNDSQIQELALDGICSSPRTLNIDHTGATHVDLSWYDDNGLPTDWDIAYVASGGVLENATIISAIQEPEYTVRELSPGIAYDFYIRSNCTAGHTDWSQAFSTTTSTIIYVDVNAIGAGDGSSWADAYTSLPSAAITAGSGRELWVAAGVYLGGYSRASSIYINNGAHLYGGFDGTETRLEQRDFRANVTVISGDVQGDDNANILDTEATRQDNLYHVITLTREVQDIIIDGFTISGGNANGSSTYNQRGAAIIAYPKAVNDDISAIIRNCVLEKNSGTSVAIYSPYSDSGVQNISTDMDFEGCIIRDNYSDLLSAMLFSGSNGYGIYSKGSFVNSLFHDNVSNTGASCLYLGASNASGGTTAGLEMAIINTTFADNIGVDGNVINMVRAGNSTIQNSIVYHNGSVTPFLISSSGSVVSNSFVEGGQQSGTDADPIFANVSANDFSLDCTSPAISAGGATDLTLPQHDLLGKARVNGTIDLGPIEFNVPIYGTITAVAQDITVELDASGTAAITPVEVDGGSGAACGVEFSLTLDVMSFDCSHLGENVVTLTATETTGASASATATVTIVDHSAPSVVGQPITLDLDENGSASVSVADVDNGSTDNCTAEANMVLELSRSVFSCDDIGEQIIWLSATDESGNTDSTEVSVIIQDLQAPVLSFEEVTLQLNANGEATLTESHVARGAADACSVTFGFSRSDFTCDDLGGHIVNVTATDLAGNESTADLTVTVTPYIEDQSVTTSQVGSFCADGTSTAIISLAGSQADVQYYLRDSEDNSIVDGPYQGDGSGIDFSTGTLAETTTFNILGTIATESTHALTLDGVDDYIDISTSTRNITTQVTVAIWVKTTSTENQFFVSKYNGVSGYVLYMSAGAVLIDGRDNTGAYKSSGASSTVVNDGEWHYIVGTINIATGVWRIYVDGILESSTTNAVGSTLANAHIGRIGEYNNAFNLPGTIDRVELWNVALDETAIAENMSSCLTGNESGLVGLFDFAEGSGTTLTDLSTTAINGIITNVDESTAWVSGSSPSCNTGVCAYEMSTEITIGDQEAPMALAQDVTVSLDQNGAASITTAEVNNGSMDNCTAEGDLTMILDVSTFTCAEVGANTVTLSVTDASGNMATATATITVLDENSPTAIAQDITVSLDATGLAAITAAEVDNGSFAVCGSEVTLALDMTDFTCDHLGENTVTLTATDANNNSSSMTATVTVIDDLAPTITLQNISIALDENGMTSVSATDLDNGSVDNCTATGDLIFALSNTDFTCEDLGDNNITVTLTDLNGNIAAGTAIVTVVDDQSPLMATQNITLKLDESGVATIAVADIDNGSNDNCALTLALDKTSFDVSNVGENTVTLTGTDISGNVASATAIVTITDKDLQEVTFTGVGDKIFGDADFTISATTSSELSVSFSVLEGGLELVSTDETTDHGAATFKIVAAGEATILVSNEGNDDYSPLEEVLTLSVGKADQTLTIEPIANQSTSATEVVVSAVVDTGLELLYAVTGPATVEGNVIMLTGALGIVEVTVSQAGNGNYHPVSERISFEVVSKSQQSITFNTLGGSVTYGVADIPLVATSSAELPIEFALVSGPGKIQESMLTITGVGEIEIVASSGGDDFFEPASTTQVLTVGKADLSATAEDKVMVYGAEFPSLTVAYTGFVNGENASALTEVPEITTTAHQTSDVGAYPIELAGGVAANYNINLEDGTLTITKATAIITITDLAYTVDGTVKTPTVTTDPDGLDFTITYDGGVEAPSVVGSYSVEVVIDELNYSGSASATLVISNVLGTMRPDILLYPNPAHDRFRVSGAAGLTVEVFDLTGQLLIMGSASELIDVSGLGAGAYLVKVGETGIYKLIKK